MKNITGNSEISDRNLPCDRENSRGCRTLFYKKELDMRRMKQDAVSAVTIYRDFETDGKKMRGSANINIFRR